MQAADQNLKQALLDQQTFNDILRLAVVDEHNFVAIKNALQSAFSSPHHGNLQKSALFLTKETSGALELGAHNHLSSRLLDLCEGKAFVRFLSELTSLAKPASFSQQIKSHNNVHYGRLTSLSLITILIQTQGGVNLGLLVIFPESGGELSNAARSYLTGLAEVFACIVEKQRVFSSKHAEFGKLAYLQHALDEHALVSETDIKGTITFANDKFCEISQYSRNELIGQNHRILKTDFHPKSFFAEMYKTIANGDTWNGEIQNRKKDGSIYWLEATIVPSKNQNGKVTHYTSIRTDITARKASAALEISNKLHKTRVVKLEKLRVELELKSEQAIKSAQKIRRLKDEQTENLEYLLTSVNSMRHGFAIWDSKDQLVLVNNAYRDFHAPIKDLLVPGLKINDLFAQGFDRGVWNTGKSTKTQWLSDKGANRQKDLGFSRENQLADGRFIIYEGRRQQTGETITTLIDVTAQRDREQQLKIAKDQIETIAYFDTLTGLPNRAHCQRDLAREFGAQSSGKKFAIIEIDLDKFKRINDTLGHPAGDHLLSVLGSRLGMLGQEIPDFRCYRWGGDEFIAFIGRDENTDLEAVCQELNDLIAIPLQFEGATMRPTVSLGVARFPEDAGDLKSMMIFADLALYRTKQLGRDGYNFFTPELKREVDAEAKLEDELRLALEENQFELYYQPQIDLANNDITGLEALLRWNHPTRGLLAPGNFLAVTESSGLAPRLGRLVFAKAMTAIRTWLDDGIRFGRLAVNLSPAHLVEGSMLEDLVHEMTEKEIDPGFVAVEILESYLLDDPDADIAETLTQLRRRGIRVELDDFGTGYASLSHLMQLPINGLKIDKSFIRNASRDQKNWAIVSALISMAKLMGMRVVCEGLETAEQIRSLAQIGNCSVQGYFVARPMNFENISNWIRDGKNSESLFPQSQIRNAAS